MSSNINELISQLTAISNGMDPYTKKLLGTNSDLLRQEIQELIKKTLMALDASDEAKQKAKIEKNKLAGLPAHHGLPWTDKETNWLKEVFKRVNGKVPSIWLEQKLKRKQGAIIKKCIDEKLIPFVHAIPDYIEADQSVLDLFLVKH